MPVEYIDFEKCDWRARCWVCGTYRDSEGNITNHTGCWHQRFHDHPWVRESEAEGWGRELRSVVIMSLAKRMLVAQHSFRHPRIEDLMPDAEWVKHTRMRAHVNVAGSDWQAGNMKVKKSAVDHVRLRDVSRKAFRTMQEKSPNRQLHIDHAAIARRIIGERYDEQ